jgi:very-short-patch-repair endonuclease
MRAMDGNRLRRIAARQFGVFSRRQARECGFTAYQIRRRVTEGEWQVVLGSGLAVEGLHVTPMARDRAAQLSLPGSILAGPSAARTWGIEPVGESVQLYVGVHGQARLPGVMAIYQSPDPRDVSLFNGLPTTNAACAVVECLRGMAEPAAVELLDRAVQRGWITIDDFARRIGAGTGRRGTRRLLALLSLARAGERSAAERLLTGALRRAGIQGWRANVEIRDCAGVIGIADVAFEAARVVVEVDGWAYHSGPDRFQRDRTRQNRLVAAGWTVLRFTWSDLRYRPMNVITSIRRCVDD